MKEDELLAALERIEERLAKIEAILLEDSKILREIALGLGVRS